MKPRRACAERSRSIDFHKLTRFRRDMNLDLHIKQGGIHYETTYKLS